MTYSLPNSRALFFDCHPAAKPDIMALLDGMKMQHKEQLSDLLQCCLHDCELLARMNSEPANFPTWTMFTEQLTAIENKHKDRFLIKIL